MHTRVGIEFANRSASAQATKQGITWQPFFSEGLTCTHHDSPLNVVMYNCESSFSLASRQLLDVICY